VGPSERPGSSEGGTWNHTKIFQVPRRRGLLGGKRALCGAMFARRPSSLEVPGSLHVPRSVDPDRFTGTNILGDSWSGSVTVTPPTDLSQGVRQVLIFRIFHSKRVYSNHPSSCFRTDAVERRLCFTCLSPSKPLGVFSDHLTC
jgi:hypothetical protein